MQVRNALAIILVALAVPVWAQEDIDLKSGDNVVTAMTLGEGEHAVIAIHGASQNRKYFFSGNGAEFGQALAKAGFRVVAIEWAGRPPAGFAEVAAAIKHVRDKGAKRVSLMGHSRGGELAANYSRTLADGELNSVIQFGSVDDQGLAQTKTKKLFAFNKGDRWANWQPKAFEASSDPKQMIALGGSGHHVNTLVNEKTDLIEDVIALLKK